MRPRTVERGSRIENEKERKRVFDIPERVSGGGRARGRGRGRGHGSQLGIQSIEAQPTFELEKGDAKRGHGSASAFISTTTTSPTHAITNASDTVPANSNTVVLYQADELLRGGRAAQAPHHASHPLDDDGNERGIDRQGGATHQAA